MATNLLEAGMQQLTDAMQAYASSPCVYRRGNESVSLRIVPGESLLRLANDRGGQQTELWDADFFVPRADLVIGGSETEPLAGDAADITIGSITRRCEVMRPDENEPAARLVDANLVWLVHAKCLGVTNG